MLIKNVILYCSFLTIIHVECRTDNIGESKPILTSIDEKDETQIAGPPSELRVYASYNSIQVSWLPPSDGNIMIRGYQIGWGVNLPDIEKATIDPSLRQYIIQGLKPNREYVISLRAFNNIGHGFPIYETVKTSSYSKIPVVSSSSISKFDDDLLTPVGLLAKTMSSSQIHITWVDPNEEPFNQFYTIKYGLNGDLNDQMKELNTTETEHTFEGLRPDTQYEFVVKLANSQIWSLAASNRTFSAPPSSPPRDLTILGPQMEREDPTIVILNWQPPKYANGEIKEYILFYTTKLDIPEREWMMETTKGDQLSMQISGLNPTITYYFKLQAKNVKGYGPFSSLVSYAIPENIRDSNNLFYRNNQFRMEQNLTLYDQAIEIFSSNITNILLGVVILILVILIIALLIFCTQRHSNSNSTRKHIRPQKQGYIAGKTQTNCALNDLWIKQNGGRFATLMNSAGSIGGLVYEDFDLDAALSTNDGQRIVLHDHQHIATGKQMTPHLNSPIPHYQSHSVMPAYQANRDTMSRNYPSHLLLTNRQDNLTPTTPRNPHVVYTRADRQPITKVEFEGLSSTSPFEDETGSFTEIKGFYHEKNDANRSPPLSTHERPASGYQVVNNPASLCSFNTRTEIGKGSEEGMRETGQQQKIAHIVRPIICVNAPNSSPSTIRNVTAQRTPPMIGQRFTAAGNGKVPIGRATAQPRVNIANANSTESSASPYSSVRVQRDSREFSDGNGGMERDDQLKIQQQNRLNGSMEELNVQEIDQMICTLQELQHEFTANGEN